MEMMYQSYRRNFTLLMFFTLLLVGSRTALAESHSAEVSSHFVIKGGDVYDKKTGLTWARCSVGQVWKQGAGCIGSVKTFTFDQAQHLEKGEWRLPTKEELITIVNHNHSNSKQISAIDASAFPDSDESKIDYWTSSPDDFSNGWGVYFGDGDIYSYSRTNPLAVRMVRDGQ